MQWDCLIALSLLKNLIYLLRLKVLVNWLETILPGFSANKIPETLETSRLCRQRNDPSQCDTTNRQNPPIQLTCLNLLSFEIYNVLELSQLSINGMGLTKPLTTSLNPTSKHSSHLRKPSKGGRWRWGWHNRLSTKPWCMVDQLGIKS